jgi:hypothetical protein
VVGTPLLGGLVAQFAFWTLVVYGLLDGELGVRGAAAYVVLWAAAEFGLPHVARFGSLFVTPTIAIIDIVLVFKVMKGDVTLG